MLYILKLKNMLCFSMVVNVLSGCGGSDDSNENSSRLAKANIEQVVFLEALAENDYGARVFDGSYPPPALPEINLHREAIEYAKVLDGKDGLEGAVPNGFEKRSRSYTLHTDGRSLVEGVVLPLATKTAIIRVIPEGAVALNKNIFDVYEKSGTEVDKLHKTIFDSDALLSAGLLSPTNTLALKLASGTMMGDVVLKSSKDLSKHTKYNIHVLEADSPHVLTLTSARTKLHHGDRFQAKLRLSDDMSFLPISMVQAWVVQPGGVVKTSVVVDVVDGLAHANLDTSTFSTKHPGLWEFHTSVVHGEGSTRVIRDAKVAFAVSAKTASLAEQVRIIWPDSDSESLQLVFDVEASLAGRYEVSGVLWGANSFGDEVAGVYVSSARWLDSNDQIALSISSDKLLEAGISPPYRLKSLRLKDQTRMAELWSQESALSFISHHQ